MKETTKNILRKNDYVTTKFGLINYLHDHNKLPFVSNMWRKTINYYMKLTIKELEKFI